MQAKTRIQITLEVQHDEVVDSEDLARRIATVVHCATNGLSFDENKLLHDVRMFDVTVDGTRVTRTHDQVDDERDDVLISDDDVDWIERRLDAGETLLLPGFSNLATMRRLIAHIRKSK